MLKWRCGGPARMRSVSVLVAALVTVSAAAQPTVNPGPETGFAELWRTKIRYASGIALDEQNRPWVFSADTRPAVLRLGPEGEVVETVMLKLPRRPPASYLKQRELAILPDGAFLIADLRFQANGSYVGRYDDSGFLLSLGLDAALYATRFDGVRRLRTTDGVTLQQYGALGVGPSRLLSPGRVASDGKRLLVVDDGAIKVFAADGTFRYALGGLLDSLPANHAPRTPHNDLALDARGMLYVATAEAVVVLDQDYRVVDQVSVRLPLRLAIGEGGRLFVISGAGTGAMVVAFDARIPGTGNRDDALPRFTAEVMQRAVAPPQMLITPWRRGRGGAVVSAGKREHVRDLVADPRQPGVLWLATGNGLLRWSPQTQGARIWTAADGLPVGPPGSLWVDREENYLWVATSGGLARIAFDDLERGVETIGTGEPRATGASGFLGAAPAQQGIWYWSAEGLYSVRAEDSESQRTRFPETPVSMVRLDNRILLHDSRRLWQFDPAAGELSLLLTVDALRDADPDGPAALPVLSHLAVDPERGEIWIGTRAHGVFKHDLQSGTTVHPAFQREVGAACGVSPVHGRFAGRVVMAGEVRYVHVAQCMGRLDERGVSVLLNQLGTAGPVVDAAGAVWVATRGAVHRLDATDNRRFEVPAVAMAETP
jgi:ligand-binding sensor domain-containing protein